MRKTAILAALAGIWWWRRSGRKNRIENASSGEGPSLKNAARKTGAKFAQDRSPLDAVSLYLNGFHFFADDMGRQAEAHHYCTPLSDDLMQCVIYDGNELNSRLIGIEYIVSERLFKSFPEEEKRYWHSHQYAVKSGQLIAPSLPAQDEHGVMERLVTTYGKIWYAWDTHQKGLPFGIPQLLMDFAADGQVDSDLLAIRDRRLGISTPEVRRGRADISVSDLVPGADFWQGGRTYQLHVEVKPVTARAEAVTQEEETVSPHH